MTTQTIRELNDRFRQSSRDHYWMTRGIIELPERHVTAILKKVQKFRAFDEENDPNGEHDCGVFTYRGHKIGWKIDYYDATDPEGQRDSENPADPSITRRSLRVVLIDDY